MHQSRLVGSCGPARISPLTAFVVLIFHKDVTARQGCCVRAATGGCTVAASAVTDSLELSVVVSSARINLFSPSKTASKSTFSGDQRRSALCSFNYLRSIFDFFVSILLNSVFHDRCILSNSEAKKLQKLYTQILATPTHYATDLP